MKGKTNSAKRLLVVLRKIKKHAKNQKGSQCLTELFPALAEKTSPVRVYAEIIALASKAKDDLSLLRMDTGPSIKTIDEILTAFENYSLTASIQNLQNQVTDTSLRGLEFCASILDVESPEEIVLEKDLQNLLRRVQDLMDEVVKCDIASRLKRFVLDKLSNIEQAISLYEFHGKQPVEISLEAALGGGAVRECAGVPDAEFRETGLWDKFTALVATAIVVIELVNTSVDFLQNTSQAKQWLLEHDSSLSADSVPAEETDGSP